MFSKLDLSGSMLKGAVLGLLSITMLHGQSRITCSSNGSTRTVCPADTRGGVRLIRQISGTRCIEGRNWGTDRRGIWVDQGCRAEFVLGRQGGMPGTPIPGVVPGRPMPPQGGRPITQMVNCSSESGGRVTCPIPGNGQVRLIKQRSGSPCQRGSTWGTQPGSVWVDRGCRADFEVTVYR